MGVYKRTNEHCVGQRPAARSGWDRGCELEQITRRPAAVIDRDCILGVARHPGGVGSVERSCREQERICGEAPQPQNERADIHE